MKDKFDVLNVDNMDLIKKLRKRNYPFNRSAKYMDTKRNKRKRDKNNKKDEQ